MLGASKNGVALHFDASYSEDGNQFCRNDDPAPNSVDVKGGEGGGMRVEGRGEDGNNRRRPPEMPHSGLSGGHVPLLHPHASHPGTRASGLECHPAFSCVHSCVPDVHLPVPDVHWRRPGVHLRVSSRWSCWSGWLRGFSDREGCDFSSESGFGRIRRGVRCAGLRLVGCLR